MVVADLARVLARKGPERPAVLVYVARDGQRQALLENGLAFVAPEIEVLSTSRRGTASPMTACRRTPPSRPSG